MEFSRRIADRGRAKAAPKAHRVVRPGSAAPAIRLPMGLRDLVRGLRASARRAEAFETVLRALVAIDTPEGVARRIVGLAFDWFGGDGWATLATPEGRGLSWLADRGITSTRRTAITALASRVIDEGRATWCEDVSRMGPTRLRSRFSALALPLRSDGRVVGVLVGIDAPGRRVAAEVPGPCPTPDSCSALWLMLDPLGTALEAAMRLARTEQLSSIDDLTGLYNSRFLAGALQRETKRALRTQRPLSVLFVDLDGFKGINDRWGHLCGSRALVEAAARIASAARETDIVARYGGDEFAIVLPETPAEGALIVARRVRERIASHSFLESEGIGYRLTASVGTATLPDAAVAPEDLLAAADAAMYRVKARGKDGIEMAAAGAGPQDGKP